jgi:hypothetical protein
MIELSAGVSYLTSHYHPPEGRLLGKLASAGQALFGVDIRIADAEGHECRGIPLANCWCAAPS